MEEQTKKLLEWQLDNLTEYRKALINKGLMEAVETVDYMLKGTEQFLDNPEMLNNI